VIRRAIGWSMQEIMALPWDELCAEMDEARVIEGIR
jgi:hypothetical protein